MKTSLSHILPVYRACQILGEVKVRRIVQTLMQLRTRGTPIQANILNDNSSNNNTSSRQDGDNDTNGASLKKPDQEELWDEELEQLVEALFYMPNQLPHGAKPPTNPNQPPVTLPTPPVIAQSWKKLTSHSRMFGLDKALLFRFLVPNVAQPHSGPQGHMGLFDCWVYTLQGHAPSSSATYYGGAASNLVYIPDVLIFLAVCQEYHKNYYRTGAVPPPPPPPGSSPTTTAAAAAAAKKDDESNESDGENSSKSDEEENDNDNDDDAADAAARDHLKRQAQIQWSLKTMAKLSFRFYDSYQKKGSLARDTLHRFLTDVYGEDSYKTLPMRQLLDQLFAPTDNTSNNATAEDTAADPQSTTTLPSQQQNIQLSESQFVQRIINTTPTLAAQQVVQKSHAPHISGGHVLLDWICLLGMAMVPPSELPSSTTAYLETMQVHPQPIVHQYLLAETRLYEIKRRFHSLVESSAVINKGDIMAVVAENENDDTVDEDTKVASTSNAAAVPTVPKHVITQSAFETAVSSPNDDMGQGGFLPPRLARLVFGAVLKGGATGLMVSNNNDNDEDVDDDDEENHDGRTDDIVVPSSKANKSYWGLYHVLKFGCEAVRLTKEAKVHKGKAKRVNPRERDMPLLKLMFAMFAQLQIPNRDNSSKSKRPTKDPLDNVVVMTRPQIAGMLALLLEHADFRLQQDARVNSDIGDSSARDDDDDDDGAFEMSDETLVSASQCALLGLLPPLDNPPSPTEQVSLNALVDYVLDQAKSSDSDSKEDKDTLSLEEFCFWQFGPQTALEHGEEKSKFVTANEKRRLGPLMLELRLVAAVFFGIPPTLASMEVTLVAELQKRHKHRYPPTDVSRRGPKGTVWYIINLGWFQNWASLVKRVSHTVDDASDGRNDSTTTSSRTLPKINNTSLLAEGGSLALRADIRWGHEYEILPPLAYSALQAWYDGGPPIHRTVVPYVPSNSVSPHSKKQPKIRTEMEMELYPFFVTVFLCDATSRGDAMPFQQYVPVSRVSPIRVVLLQLAKGLNADPNLCRLWMMGTEPDSTNENADTDWLLDLDKNIVEQRNQRRQTHPGSATAASGEAGGIALLLELKDEETMTWPRGVDGKSRSYLEKRAQQDPDEPEMGDGVVGLYNMGNTCYLNSSIQCLSHTPIFREYFTSKAYLNDINTTNPLGHGGRLAQVSAVLISSLWKRFNNQMGSVASTSYNPRKPKRVTAPGSYCPVNAPSLTPKTFKDSLGKFNEEFAGNEQHDAQELLTFLLDGLSEDLNRIVEKPYIEQPDSNGEMSDAELADIWWSNHLKREMSIIVALFTGQYKSLLTCRSCKYESSRFEPFMYLQLPLPEDEHIPVSVVLYPLSEANENGKPSTPADVYKFSVRVKNDGNLFDVLFALAKVMYVDEVNKAAEDDENNSERQKELQRLSSTSSEDIHALEQIYVTRAKNMAVVDMRDGYISKVASNSWSLPDLQNKDTGELPLLHVYELDPLPEEDMGSSHRVGELGRDDDEIQPKKGPIVDERVDQEGEDDGDENADDETSRGSEENDVSMPPPAQPDAKYSFLAIAQRKSEVVSQDLLHPLSHRVFGTPMLLRVQNLECYTGRDLYDLVAVRLRTFVPTSALRFLEKDGDAPDAVASQQEGNATALRGRQRLKKTTTDMEEVSAGPVPRYGFRLRITTRDGRKCTLCPWFECCIGCLIPDDEYPTIVMCGDSVAVDWHFAVDVATSGFGQRINSQIDPLVGSSGNIPRRAIPGVTIKNHSSLGVGPKKTGTTGAITLEDCLHNFSKEERIPEAYCSKCKDFRVQMKRLSLWRLPPVVIIQLKRFQYNQHTRRKLRDLVVFPIEGLDLSPFVASDSESPPGTKVPKSSEKPPKKKANKKKKETSKSSNSNGSSPYLEEPEASTTETSSEVPLSSDDGRSEMLYDLYGVVHHQGALSTGHYVASLKSDLDGQWRLFNDAQIYEIHNRDVVDSSAYILFYIRRDVKDARLSDYWDTSAREGSGVSEQDMEKFLNGQRGSSTAEKCVIS